MAEMWRFIDGYENYQVSTYGNIKRTIDDKIMKQTTNSHGYKVVNLNKKQFKVHRLVCEAFCDNPNGYNKVDHINREKLDNHYTNLRFCTCEENSFNQSIRKTNMSGVRGVSFDKRRNKWRARINIAGKEINIGHFQYFDEAKEARLKKEKELFKEFAPN